MQAESQSMKIAPCSFAGMPALPTRMLDGLHVNIKNTFIHVDDHTPSTCSHGARTCMARVNSDEDASPWPKVAEFFLEPAQASDVMHCSFNEEEPCTSPSSSRGTGGNEDSPHILIQLAPDTRQTLESVNAEVCRSFIANGTDNRCIDLRVVLDGLHFSKNLFHVGQILPVRMASEDQAPCLSRSSTRASDATNGACTPDAITERVTDDEYESCAPKLKSSMVCRHWKHGWCKYEDNCRFLHPADKKGCIGSNPSDESGLVPPKPKPRTKRSRCRAAHVHNTVTAPLPVGIVQI